VSVGSEYLAIEAPSEGLRVFRLSKAEHHEVAVIGRTDYVSGLADRAAAEQNITLPLMRPIAMRSAELSTKLCRMAFQTLPVPIPERLSRHEPPANRVLNVAAPSAPSVAEIATTIARHTGYEGQIVEVPGEDYPTTLGSILSAAPFHSRGSGRMRVGLFSCHDLCGSRQVDL
jgi:hypothetical protein